MGKYTVKIVLSAIVIVTVMLVKYLMNLPLEQPVASKMEQHIEQLRRESIGKHPELPISEAMRRDALERTEADLRSQLTEQKRLAAAAAQFFGFYLMSTQTRADYCREQGVDIETYLDAFRRAHATELAKVRKATLQNPIDEIQLYAELEPEFRKAAVQGFKDFASMYKISIRDTCKLFSKNGPAMAGAMHLSKLNPSLYQMITNIQ